MLFRDFILVIICFLVLMNVGWGQRFIGTQFDSAVGCTENAQGQNFSYRMRKQIGSTVKVDFDGSGICSATLVNQMTPENELRQILILARHCITEGMGLDNEIIADLTSNQHVVIFHYQSPTDNINNTPQNNRGTDGWAVNSTPISSPLSNIPNSDIEDDGYRYLLSSSLTQVATNKWGDYLLLEIDEPIPPHFNPYYAGVYNLPAVTPIQSPFYGFHHPAGDIKKTSRYPVVSIYDGHIRYCHLMGSAVDFLFGWIWGNSSSVKRFCRYISIPWYAATANFGVTEGGSSGSGLFESLNKRHMGPLSGAGIGGCTVNTIHYTRNFDHFFDNDIRGVLNPDNLLWVDNGGFGGRYRSCYGHLNLNGYYWPHVGHQATGPNGVSIESAANINLARNDQGQPRVQWVMDNSSYDLKAAVGHTVTAAGPGFDQAHNLYVQPGAQFSLRVASSPCNTAGNNYKNTSNRELMNQTIERLIAKGTPRTSQQKEIVNVYPVPASKTLNIDGPAFLAFDKLIFYDAQGRRVKTIGLKAASAHHSVDVSSWSAGLYHLTLIRAGEVVARKKVQIAGL
jgi:hypothetical protein